MKAPSERSGWDDARTAALYDEFTREFPMYDETSRDLIALGDVKTASSIVDLGCGTGVTTRAVLQTVADDATVVSIDASAAMLAVAQDLTGDQRVRWVHADATDLAEHTSKVDVILCNSAIWQMDMRAVFAAAASVLTPDGRLAFNIGRHFMILPFTPEELSPSKLSLADYINAIAVLEYDFVARRARRGGGRPLSEEGIREMLSEAKLHLDVFEIRTYESTLARQRAWLKIPIFADNILAGMPYQRQVEVIEKAYARVDPNEVELSRWAYFVARPE